MLAQSFINKKISFFKNIKRKFAPGLNLAYACDPMTKNPTKVYSLQINNGIVSAKFIGTLSGKNIIRTTPGICFIKARANKTIRYELLDDFKKDEIPFLESQIV